MSKAILILDNMPKCCLGCPCGSGEIYQAIDCKATGKRIDISVGFHNRSDECPLKEMPSKYKMKEMPYFMVRHSDPAEVKMFLAGWNACIGWIEGENDAD